MTIYWLRLWCAFDIKDLNDAVVLELTAATDYSHLQTHYAVSVIQGKITVCQMEVHLHSIIHQQKLCSMLFFTEPVCLHRSFDGYNPQIGDREGLHTGLKRNTDVYAV